VFVCHMCGKEAPNPDKEVEEFFVCEECLDICISTPFDFVVDELPNELAITCCSAGLKPFWSEGDWDLVRAWKDLGYKALEDARE